MERIMGNFKITRRNSEHEALSQYFDNQVNSFQNVEPTQPTVIQDDTSLMEQHFSHNIEIMRNGQKTSKYDYYGDFKTSPYSMNSHKPVRATNEPIEQVDPAAFFGSSMNGLLKNIRG